VPWFRDFCGCVLQETDGSFVVRGKIEVNASKHYIDILEIPPDVTIQDYKRTLVALQPDHFRNFTEHHHGNRVHFRLHEPRANLTTADSVFLIKMFKLQSKIAMSNMVLFDSTQMIRKYGRVEDILDEFFQVRRTHYELRRAHQID
jgi:DNA topoisomerase-2